MRITIAAITALMWIAGSGSIHAQSADRRDVVPDAETAVAIARAVLIPAYGAKTIEQEEPLVAKDQGDRWLVEGTFNCPKGYSCLGGTAEVEIAKRDGRILRMVHSA